ncbi:MAG: hypothetical protein B6D47_00250, partial [Rhodocyclaceae bacterium UTPRO2]
MRTRLPSLARSAVIPAKAGIRHLARALVAGALLASALPAGAETLGRLFFTPERRAALERQRQLNIRETQKTIEGAELGVSGIVQRSSG